MNIYKFSEVISLSLTVPAVLLGLLVVVIWWRSGLKALRSSARTGTDWLILGIIISFIGSSLDNIYWGIAWGASLFELDSRDFWFQNGVYANIPLRQSAGIIAALCHIQGAVDWASSGAESRGVMQKILIAIWVAGCLTCVALIQNLYQS